MRLGTQTGSLINHVLTFGMKPAAPEVGAPATICYWSDREPATVFRVFMVGKSIIVETRDDDCVRVDNNNGISEAQEYEYKTKVNGHKRYWRITDKGVQAVEQNGGGRWVKGPSGAVVFGRREKFHDYSF